MRIPVRLKEDTALCLYNTRISTEHRLLGRTAWAGTHAVCLRHVHVAVGVVVHLLVDATDRLVAEDPIFILAQWRINATKLWWKNRVMSI